MDFPRAWSIADRYITVEDANGQRAVGMIYRPEDGKIAVAAPVALRHLKRLVTLIQAGYEIHAGTLAEAEQFLTDLGIEIPTAD